MPPRGKGGAKGKGKASKGGSDSRAGTPLFEAPKPVKPVYVPEDVWVQCDACQKWRRLPPGTVVDDEAAWYCNQNPDKSKASCSVPEEDYDANNEVVIASTDPYYQSLVPQDVNEGRHALAKAGVLTGPHGTPPPGGMPAPPPEPPKKRLPERAFTSLQEELHQLVRACQQLVAQAGVWEAPSEGGANGAAGPVPGSQRPFGQSQPPHWVWSGLAHLAPEATQVAVEAVDVVTALEHFAGSGIGAAGLGSGAAGDASGSTGQPGGAESIDRAKTLARLALLSAAAIALPKAQEAERNPSTLVLTASATQPAPAAGQQGSGAAASVQPQLPGQMPGMNLNPAEMPGQQGPGMPSLGNGSIGGSFGNQMPQLGAPQMGALPLQPQMQPQLQLQLQPQMQLQPQGLLQPGLLQTPPGMNLGAPSLNLAPGTGLPLMSGMAPMQWAPGGPM